MRARNYSLSVTEDASILDVLSANRKLSEPHRVATLHTRKIQIAPGALPAASAAHSFDDKQMSFSCCSNAAHYHTRPFTLRYLSKS